jgi:hypothetical protein
MPALGLRVAKGAEGIKTHSLVHWFSPTYSPEPFVSVRIPHIVSFRLHPSLQEENNSEALLFSSLLFSSNVQLFCVTLFCLNDIPGGQKSLSPKLRTSPAGTKSFDPSATKCSDSGDLT